VGLSFFAFFNALGAEVNCVDVAAPGSAQTQTSLCTDEEQFPIGQEIEITVRFADQDDVFIDPDPFSQIYTLRLIQFLEDGTQQSSECNINGDVQDLDCRMTKADVGEYNYHINPATAGDWQIELRWRCPGVTCNPVRVSKLDLSVFVPGPNNVVTTTPSGLSVAVDGSTYLTPHTFAWELGTCHTIGAPSPQLGNNARFLFKSWSDGKAQTHQVCAGNESVTYRAEFETQYLMTLSVNPAGAGQVISDKQWYPAGTYAQIEAKPKAGFCFIKWLGDIPSTQRTANPAQLLMDRGKTITAVFAECVKITVTTDPPGLQVLVDGSTQTSTPTTFRWLVGSNHTLGANSPQPGGSGVRYIFDHWSDTGKQSHPIITPTQDTTYTAVFRPQYALTTAYTPSVGGTVNPATEQWFDPEAIATATAVPAKCFGFSNWEGDATGTQNPVSMAMNKPKRVTARFFTGEIATRFETNPPGLKLIIDGIEYATPQTFNWPICSPHTVNAITPQLGTAGYRYLFASWSDKGRAGHTITTPGAVTTSVANYNTQCALTASVEPATWGRIRPSGLVWLPCGASVTLTPRTRRGAIFVEWRGDASGSAFPLTITLDRPKNIIAYLNAIPKANFAINPLNGKMLEPIQFTDQSIDPNGETDIVGWQWDFGDQTTSTERNPSHIYAAAARYRVCLTVTDIYNSSGTTCKKAKVNINRPPIAAFIFAPTNPNIGQMVTFDPVTSKDVDGAVAQYAWDYGGDGTFETVYSGYATTTRAFKQIGPNKVCLQVTDNSGAQSTLTCLNVTVSQASPTTGDLISVTDLVASEKSKDLIVFQAQSREIGSIQISVLSLSGQMLFDSNERLGSYVLWKLDEKIPNGVYLYSVSLRRSDGTLATMSLRKLVIQR